MLVYKCTLCVKADDKSTLLESRRYVFEWRKEDNAQGTNISLRVGDVLLFTPHSFVTVSSLITNFYFCFICPPYYCFHTFFFVMYYPFSVTCSGSVVGIPSRLQVGRRRDFGVDAGKGKKFSLLHNFRIGSEGHPAFHLIGLRVVSSKLKRPGREVNHSPSRTLVIRLRMSGPITLFILYTFTAWTGIRSHFNLYFFQQHIWFHHYLNLPSFWPPIRYVQCTLPYKCSSDSSQNSLQQTVTRWMSGNFGSVSIRGKQIFSSALRLELPWSQIGEGMKFSISHHLLLILNKPQTCSPS